MTDREKLYFASLVVLSVNSGKITTATGLDLLISLRPNIIYSKE